MSDSTVLNQTLSDMQTDFEYESKQWPYLVDMQNGGNYGTGQVTFDLSPWAGSDNWMHFPEGVLTIPLVMALSGSTTGLLTADRSNAFCMSLKNGYYQLIHNMSVQINSVTYENICNFKNMDINYKILSSFGANDAENFGASIGFAKDGNNFTYGVAGTITDNFGIGECNNVINHGSQIDPIKGGWNKTTVKTTSHVNEGRLQRMMNTSFDPNLTDNYANLVKTETEVKYENRNYCVNSNSASEIVYYILATLPLRLISPLLASLPLVKGAKVTLQIQTNTACSVTFANNGTTVVGFTNATPPVINSQGTIPFMVSPALFNDGAYGFNPITTANQKFIATIGIAKGHGTVGSGVLVPTWAHPQPTCRIYVPQYKLSPMTEELILSKNPVKTVVYNDLFSAQYPNVPADSQFQYTLPFLVAKPRYLLICMYLCSLNNGASPPSGLTGGKILGSPINSPFSSAPATCSPYLTLYNFNVQLGGQSLYQQNRNYNWEAFQAENRPSNSINGGLTNGLSSGLISEQDFVNGGYNYVYVDLSRHSLASDGTSRNISIVGTNNSKVPIDLYCFVGYERSMDINCSNGQILQAN